MRASVIIPAHRAAAMVGDTVRAVRGVPGVGEVIVVDDGSRDSTAEAAREAGANRVIVLPRNRGKGAALRAGVEAASHDLLLFLDADLGDSARHARDLLQPGWEGRSMVVAALPPSPGAGGLGLALALSRAAIRVLTGLRMAAPMSGQRAIWAPLVRHIGIAPGFGVEVGLTVEAAHLGAAPAEICVPFRHRHTGRTVSGFLHRARQFKDVLLILLRIGYGLSWPALGLAPTVLRAVAWLCALALVVVLGGLLAPPVSTWLVVTLAAVALWLPSLWVSAVLLGLRKRNYLGRTLPAASGLLLPVIALPALWLSPLEARVRVSGVLVVAALAVVGLLDDLFARRRRARGLRGHLLSLARGRVTTGAVKALGGLAAGIGAGMLLHPGSPSAIALDAVLIALTANLLNLLDLRPGRCLKGFGVVSVLALVAAACGAGALGAIGPAASGADSTALELSFRLLGPLLVAALVSAPSDLAGRTMMGDVGANVLGGAGGLALAILLGSWQRLAAVIVLLAVHVACERVSISEVVDRSRFLSFLDRLGARHLPPLRPDVGGGT